MKHFNDLRRLITDVINISNIQEGGLSFLLEGDDEYKEKWKKVWDTIKYQPVKYSKSYIDYQNLYLKSTGHEILDVSCVISSKEMPVAIWPLSLSCNVEGEFTLSSSGGGVLQPLISSGLEKKKCEKIAKAAIKLLVEIGESLLIKEILLEDFIYPDKSNYSASTWHMALAQKKCEISLAYEMFQDVSLDLQKIRANIRPSYRSLINTAKSIWIAEIYDSNDGCSKEQWQEFRKLHMRESGRVTRSSETWERQLKMINDGDAFLITIRDPKALNLVGGGFFQKTKSEAHYCVGVYSRSLFNLPLGHLVQYLAILKMKQEGLSWYYIGEYKDQLINPSVDEKNTNISNFKKGFSSHILINTKFLYKIDRF